MKRFINFLRKHIVATVVVTLLIGIFTGYYNANLLTPNGVYVVLGSDIISAEGNIQVDQLEKIVEILSIHGVKIPSGHWISANQGYERFIPGTDYLDLIYYNGLDSDGDAYSVSVKFLTNTKQFGRFYQNKYYGKYIIKTNKTTNDLRLVTAELAAVELASKQ